MFYLLYPLILAVLPPLALYVKNRREIKFRSAVVLLVLSVAFPAVVFFLAVVIGGVSMRAAAAFAFAVVLCFLLLGINGKGLNQDIFINMVLNLHYMRHYLY